MLKFLNRFFRRNPSNLPEITIQLAPTPPITVDLHLPPASNIIDSIQPVNFSHYTDIAVKLIASLERDEPFQINPQIAHAIQEIERNHPPLDLEDIIIAEHWHNPAPNHDANFDMADEGIDLSDIDDDQNENDAMAP